MREWMIQARKAKKLTMKQAADKLGISESYYCLIEGGERQTRMDIALASRLAAVFELPMEYIIEQEKAAATAGN